MARFYRTVFLLAGLGTVAAGYGFVRFAQGVATPAPDAGTKADAIVVLTGDEDRIATGVRLMVEGRATRMLISGVNPATRVPTELRRHIQQTSAKGEAIVRCCVDIGHAALNTTGNALETAQWAASHGFRSLLVVTSSYHMPRSLVEFARVMPEAELVPYPVASGRNLRLEAWWTHLPSVRLLAGEYTKLLGATARLALTRTLYPRWHAQRTPPATSVSVRATP